LAVQSLLLKDPPSYTREIPVDEGHRFVERGEIVSRFRDMDVEAIQRMKEKDTRLKRNIRRFRFGVRCAKLCCSVVVISLLSANFAIFIRTQDNLINDNGAVQPAWGDTKSWPAILLLTVASVSSLISIFVLLSYLKSVKWANRLAGVHATIMITASVVSLGIWAISAGLFHKQATGFNVPSIWSWSCNHKGSSNTSINFNQICLTQNWSFICAIIEVMLEILTLGSFLLIFVRMKSKKEMRKSMSMQISTSTANEQEARFVDGDEDQGSPSQAYADLEGQKRSFADEKDLGEKE